MKEAKQTHTDFEKYFATADAGKTVLSLKKNANYKDKSHVHNSLLSAVLHDKPALRTDDSVAIS